MRNTFAEQLQVIQQEATDRGLIFKEQRDKELISSDVYAQALLNIEYKKALGEQKIQRAAGFSKLQGVAKVAQGVADISGKESVLGKASAIAQATVNTFLGATKAIAVLGPAGPIVAGIIIAAGLAQVAAIAGVNVPTGLSAGLSSAAGGVTQIASSTIPPPQAEKGALFMAGGARHSAGGTTFTGSDGSAFEAERGEVIGVMSRGASKHFMAFNDLYSQRRGGGAKFADGGTVAPLGTNYKALAQAFAFGARNVPPPIVGVEDIAVGLENRAEVRERGT
ncbi:hypothetical protein ACOMHN_067699 [Nucella lapillus]